MKMSERSENLHKLIKLVERLETMNRDSRAYIQDKFSRTLCEISGELGKEELKVALIENMENYEKECLQTLQENSQEVNSYREELAERIEGTYKPAIKELSDQTEEDESSSRILDLIKQVNEEIADLKFIYLRGRGNRYKPRSKLLLDPLEERVLLFMIGTANLWAQT